ncbi:hypothetical protein L2E82_26095 [Cichorium intybus]|uniref:Uncharacterized protein n=1 Tax=Cichorium intybus TaxID=13427 RepID=A0ACB9E5L7_CICIN|nr:hypothetical protein L2E82_26095 [Cichorium intybus]
MEERTSGSSRPLLWSDATSCLLHHPIRYLFLCSTSAAGGLIDKHIFENQIERVLGENQGLRALLQGGLIDKHIFENQTERVLGENQGLRALLQTHHISDDTGTEPTNESEYAVTPSQKRAGRPLCELFKRQLAQRNLKHRLHELHTPYPSYIGQPNHGSFNFPKGRRTITRADNIGELSHFCEGSDMAHRMTRWQGYQKLTWRCPVKGSVFLSTHIAYELLPESGKDCNLKSYILSP